MTLEWDCKGISSIFSMISDKSLHLLIKWFVIWLIRSFQRTQWILSRNLYLTDYSTERGKHKMFIIKIIKENFKHIEYFRQTKKYRE